MVEEIPLALVFSNGMVGCPTNYWCHNHSLIGEWTIRIITNGIAEEVAVACRIGEVVLSVLFEHPYTSSALRCFPGCSIKTFSTVRRCFVSLCWRAWRRCFRISIVIFPAIMRPSLFYNNEISHKVYFTVCDDDLQYTQQTIARPIRTRRPAAP